MIDLLDNLESKLQRLDKAVLEETIRNDTLDLEIQDYLSEYNVTEEQLTQFISQKENFSEQNWQDLQSKKKEIEAKLQLAIRSSASRSHLKKAYKERSMMHHWIAVR